MKKTFIGIDVSKDTLDVAICKDLTQPISQIFQCENTPKGIKQLVKKARAFKEDLWFCFEHTGNYSLLLAQMIQEEGLIYSAVPALEIKRSQGITRGKSDKIDAQRIALYAATYAHKLKPTKLPGKVLMKLKSLLTYRSLHLSISQQLQNSMHSYKEAHKTVDLSEIIKDLNKSIEKITDKLLKIDSQIDHLIKEDEEIHANCVKIRTVKGIGPLISAYMIVYTNNFTSFDNPRKFNCYAGLAPFENTSGSSIRGRTQTSSLRNKKLKALLFNGANSAVVCDHELKNYYKRKVSEGKKKITVINAVACKLVYRIFAVVNREEPYVNLVR